MQKAVTIAVLASIPMLVSAGASVPPTVVPEPSAFSLVLLGVAMVGVIKLRNRFKK